MLVVLSRRGAHRVGCLGVGLKVRVLVGGPGEVTVDLAAQGAHVADTHGEHGGDCSLLVGELCVKRAVGEGLSVRFPSRA